MDLNCRPGTIASPAILFFGKRAQFVTTQKLPRLESRTEIPWSGSPADEVQNRYKMLRGMKHDPELLDLVLKTIEARAAFGRMSWVENGKRMEATF